MAAGVAPVCTAIGYNLELIEHEKNGYLVETSDDWKRTLEELVVSPALRERVGRAARDAVVERFSIEGQAQKLKAVLDSAIVNRNRRLGRT